MTPDCNDGAYEEKKNYNSDIPWIKDVDKDSLAYWHRYVDGKYEEWYPELDKSKPDAKESDGKTVLNDDTNVTKKHQFHWAHDWIYHFAVG